MNPILPAITCRPSSAGSWPRALCVWLLALSAWLCALPSAARELHWRELEVTARLDAEGRLHVSELHRMVFTGAWNGGERRFRVTGEQRFEFESLSRVEAGGREVRLIEGDLSRTDQFAWFETHALRWRSRLPEEPPFEQKELAYRSTTAWSAS